MLPNNLIFYLNYLSFLYSIEKKADPRRVTSTHFTMTMLPNAIFSFLFQGSQIHIISRNSHNTFEASWTQIKTDKVAETQED